MILKKQVYQPDKRAHPLIGVLLFVISVLLFVLTAAPGFIYGLVHALFTKGLRGLGEYTLKTAISIDQLGNVVMQHLLNILWVKPGGYKFGNRDETISSVLGRNRKLGGLTSLGRGVDKFLDLIDPGHSLNSIDYYIEPTEEILDQVAWIHIMDRKILCLKAPGSDKYAIPAGFRVASESDAQSLFREMKARLHVELALPSMHFMGIFEGRAEGFEPAIILRKTCYSGSFEGQLAPAETLEEIAWLTFGDRKYVSETDQLIFDFLKENGDLY